MARTQAAAQAQAQAQHQANISHTESLELVRCLLRVSIFHVSYLRGLFPEKSFKGVDMKNLDDMHIKMLLPACDESRRLVDWVEGGVYDAIKRGYLKNLFFGISNDPEGTQLLEEYIFSFKYGDGKVVMDVNAVTADGGGDGGKKRAARSKGEFKQESGAVKADLNTVRYQVCRLIRMLVQVCRTLDKVPAERYLFMKLTYQDFTPEEYEPPYFVPVDESGVGHFKRSPFSMAVGRVATDHHSVSLKVKSTLDSCDDDLADGDGAADDADGATINHHNRPSGDAGANDRVTVQAQPSAGSVGSGDVGTTTGTPMVTCDDDEVGLQQQGAEEMQRQEPQQQVTKDPVSEGGVEAMEADVDEVMGAEATAALAPTPSALAREEEADGLVGGVGIGPGEDGAKSPSRTTHGEGPQSAGAMELDAPAGAPGAEAQPPADDGGGAGGDAGGGDDDDVTEAPEAEDYLAVCEYVRGRSQVSLRQLGRQFASMSQGALGAYVGRLSAQGLLAAVPGAKNTFRVLTPTQPQGDVQSAPPAAKDPAPPAAKDPAPPAAAGDGVAAQRQSRLRLKKQKGDAEDAAALLTERLDGLTMGAGAEPARGAAAGAAVAAGAVVADAADGDDSRQRDQAAREGDAALRSCGGRVESAQAGDEMTGSAEAAGAPGSNRAAGGAAAAPAADEPGVYIADSQQSGLERGRGGRVRKASYVADPIQQGGAAKKTKTAAGRAAPAAAAAAPAAKAAAAAPAAKAAAAAPAAAATPRAARGAARLAAMKR